MLIRILLQTILLQIFCKMIFYSQDIGKSMIVPDDNFTTALWVQAPSLTSAQFICHAATLNMSVYSLTIECPDFMTDM